MAKKYTTAKIIQALKAANGGAYAAAAALGCSHETIYNAIRTNPDVKAAFESERGLMLDCAENELYNAIKRGESWAVLFALKTAGKSRGYSERQELAHSHNPEDQKLEIIVTYADGLLDHPSE